MIAIRTALPTDLDRCLEITADARAFQREQGFTQWTDGYPAREDLERDLAAGGARVLLVDDVMAGYFYLGFNGDPHYASIDGAWGAGEPYAVIHRVAIDGAFRGQGLMGELFSLAAAECREHGIGWIRIDTGLQNARMQHVLEKHGFTRRGIVQLPAGPRVAYDREVDA